MRTWTRRHGSQRNSDTIDMKIDDSIEPTDLCMVFVSNDNGRPIYHVFEIASEEECRQLLSVVHRLFNSFGG